MPKIHDRERRYTSILPLAVVKRSDAPEDEAPKVIEGYASTWDAYDMGDWIEQIDRSAFDEALSKRGEDIACLFNHDTNLVLGRRGVNLEVWTDARGLGYRCDPELTTYASDLILNLKRGIVARSSFGFSMRDGDDDWSWPQEAAKPLRKILRIGDVFDTSPVTFPANPTTEASARVMARVEELRSARINAPTPGARRRFARAMMPLPV